MSTIEMHTVEVVCWSVFNIWSPVEESLDLEYFLTCVA